MSPRSRKSTLAVASFVAVAAAATIWPLGCQRSGIPGEKQADARRHLVGAGHGLLGLRLANSSWIVRGDTDVRSRRGGERENDETRGFGWAERP